jgi:hypothetical protein
MIQARRRLFTTILPILAALGLAQSAAIAAGAGGYDAARWDPIHFKPAIESARDAQCLACHQEILERRVSPQTPAGLKTAQTLAWYQTLGTYRGEQETFHRRHLVTDFAKQVMDLRCNTCHQGNDPREETAGSAADTDRTLIQRKHVDPQVCLLCHGQHNATVIRSITSSPRPSRPPRSRIRTSASAATAVALGIRRSTLTHATPGPAAATRSLIGREGGRPNPMRVS